MPTAAFPTPLGTCSISWQDDMLTGFQLPPASGEAAAIPPWVANVITRVQRHLTGELQDFSDLPYAFESVGDFAGQVYRATLQVKAGATCSYGEIAQKLGQLPAVSRAVGTALGANPWPLLVPCHRVVAGDGKMTGFSGPGGVKTKLRLLALEGAQLFAE
ncbi:MAG TPA: methylated-DNA--[protein]-cysteine S-methyltransferase [Opitutaceae bacterium]|nr:methylated-DNA--[protein]-cysteine S-methyltransferase [Opitutaceae bacterium]